MKPGKLYLKIFTSFVIILILAEIAIFGYFILFIGRHNSDFFNQINDSRFLMAKELIEYRLKENPLDLEGDKKAFKAYIDHLGLAFGTRIWITDKNNELVFKSFKERIPQKVIRRQKKERDNHKLGRRPSFLSHFIVYRSDRLTTGHPGIYTLHILNGEKPPIKYRLQFALGLLFIGSLIALLTLPVSRHISRNVKTLTQSAKKLESGDLSHRTTVNTRDEIGELGTAFNRMAEKLENMVQTGKEMKAQVSHELRSPLARIQISVELLKDQLATIEGSDLQTHLKEIEDEIAELDRLIGRILELSKLDLQVTPNKEVFSPARLTHSLLGKYTSSIASKKIYLDVDLKGNAKVLGDRQSFTTAINNLLDNALRYTPVKGKIILSESEQEGEVLLSIINSCTELTEEQLRRIFEPFYRVDPTRENCGGLGLAIVSKIIETHQGTISATNHKEGLEIAIRLPQVKVD